MSGSTGSTGIAGSACLGAWAKVPPGVSPFGLVPEAPPF